jgi:hypothetical protein
MGHHGGVARPSRDPDAPCHLLDGSSWRATEKHCGAKGSVMRVEFRGAL